MPSLLQQIQNLAAAGELKISDHGYDELSNDGILADDAVNGLDRAVVVEEYPNYPKGPCVLVLETESAGDPIHVLWGIPAGKQSPAVLITAYRPDPSRWAPDFLQRRP